MSDFWKNKRVLVTGGAGFIGTHVVKELIQKGAIVTVTISKNGKTNKQIFPSHGTKNKLTTETADLLSLEDCLRVTARQDVVLNFAAVDGGKQFKSGNSEFIFRVNTEIVLNLLQAAKQNKVERLLVTSSIEVYSLSSIKNLTEDINFQLNWNRDFDGYIWSKVVSELAAKMYTKENSMKIGVIRLGNVYGPNDYTGVERGRVIPTFIHKALLNEDITIIGNGAHEKSFLFVDDAVNGILDFMEKLPTSGLMNIVGEHYISIKDLAFLIKNICKSSSRIIHIESDYHIPNRRISVQKAVKLIGFKEKVSLRNGIQKTIEFFINNKP